MLLGNIQHRIGVGSTLFKCCSSSVLPRGFDHRFTVIACEKYSSSREARFISKLLSKGQSKRKFKVFEMAPTSIDYNPEKQHKKVDTRRISVLNKLFIGYISDLIATGSWHHPLIEKGVEITRVAVNPNFRNINVFWYSAKKCDDMEPILNDVAHRLHHELSQLKLMGVVPKITLVKDTHKEKLIEVEKLLQSISANSTSSDKANHEPPPRDDFKELDEIPMKVYGLEHDKIMKKIGFGTSKNQYMEKEKQEDSTSSDSRKN